MHRSITLRRTEVRWSITLKRAEVRWIHSGRRFTGRNGITTSEPVTENDSNYFKLLETDGDSLLVGAR
ncbi:hypothetical protein LOAG_13289 [Loa loa]|uniref:Uncharacterized protein n=1 Tax=Loa loa TaxID=7209 RepID=A0A1S0TJR0_LOALO|nr:hypothetical protein LOAG_13289 [Loa loa]EFO15222.1 hypothetical protein LOAG_13289 [Loa loa]